jgi:hypothetical protein
MRASASSMLSEGEQFAESEPRWSAHEFQCGICYELLLDPVVGERAGLLGRHGPGPGYRAGGGPAGPETPPAGSDSLTWRNCGRSGCSAAPAWNRPTEMPPELATSRAPVALGSGHFSASLGRRELRA